MRIYKDIDLKDFEFWSGAKDTVEYLTDDELDTIESLLVETEPEEGYDETYINDFFWFEDELIAEWLGYNSFEEIMNRDDVNESLTENNDTSYIGIYEITNSDSILVWNINYGIEDEVVYSFNQGERKTAVVEYDENDEAYFMADEIKVPLNDVIKAN